MDRERERRRKSKADFLIFLKENNGMDREREKKEEQGRLTHYCGVAGSGY